MRAEVVKNYRRLHAYRFGDTLFSKAGVQVGTPDEIGLVRGWVSENWRIRDLSAFREACLGAEYPDDVKALVGHEPWESEIADGMRKRGAYDSAVREAWNISCALRGNGATGDLA